MQMNGENQTFVLKFANGFPPGRVIGKPCGGYFLASQRDVERKSPQRLIPPLARGRGRPVPCRITRDEAQFTQQRRIQSVPPAEITERPGFPPQNVLHAKPPPKMTRSSDPQVFSPPPTVAELRAMTKKIARFYTVEPLLRTDNADGEGTMSPSCTPTDQQSLVLRDMEHAISHHELSGLEEVYQRVLKGNKETLHNFISHSRRPFVHSVTTPYIKTSTPIPIRKSKSKCTLEALGFAKQDSKETDDKEDGKGRNRAVLVPLSFVPSDSKPEDIQRRQKQKLYEKPHVYQVSFPRSSPTKRSSEPSPRIVNLDMGSLPDSGRLSSHGAFMGSSVGHTSRTNTGKHLMPILPTPPTTPRNFERDSDTIHQDKSLPDERKASTTSGQSSEDDIRSSLNVVRIKTADLLSEITELSEKSSVGAHKTEDTEHDKEINSKDSNNSDQDKESLQGRVSAAVSLNVTGEDGEEAEVEIYVPDERDLEKAQAVEAIAQKSLELGQKKKEEVDNLIKEYNDIKQEIRSLQSSEGSNVEDVKDEDDDNPKEWSQEDLSSEQVENTKEPTEKETVENEEQDS